jgi:hypothetical protein
MNKFQVELAFFISKSKSLIIGGEIVQGEIKQNMKVIIGGKQYIVSALTYLDRTNGLVSLVGIILKADSTSQGLKLADEIHNSKPMLLLNE